MNDERSKADETNERWHGAGAHGWIASEALLDELFQPMEDALVGDLSPATARRVLDVGCGTGSTTVAAARRLGEAGRCTGVDVSAPMIAAARERAARAGVDVELVVADAALHPFEAGAFDAVISRFGVMFFADPVGAFANLRRAAKTGARLRFVAWRSVDENRFMVAAERAAAPLLPDLPPRRTDEPGQFALADPARVRAILEASGWSSIELRAVDVPCSLPAAALETYVTRLGPVGRALEAAGADLRARVLDAVRPAFAAFTRGAELRFDAACWQLDARA